MFRLTYPNQSHMFKGNGKTSAIARKKKEIVKDSGKVTKYRKKNRKKKESMSARQNPPNSVFRKFVRCHTAFSTRSITAPTKCSLRLSVLICFCFFFYLSETDFTNGGTFLCRSNTASRKCSGKLKFTRFI